MGQLTENAQKRFKKASRVHVPEWFATGQVVALIAIPVLLVASYFVQSKSNEKSLSSEYTGSVSTLPAGQSSDSTTPTLPDDNGSSENMTPTDVPGGTVTVGRPGGGSVNVPAAALAAAKAAGLASYNGDWSNVPITGNRPAAQAIYPDARVGTPLAYSVADNAVTFAFQLDRDGNGSSDMSFQISVVQISGRWVFPVSGA